MTAEDRGARVTFDVVDSAEVRPQARAMESPHVQRFIELLAVAQRRIWERAALAASGMPGGDVEAGPPQEVGD